MNKLLVFVLIFTVILGTLFMATALNKWSNSNATKEIGDCLGRSCAIGEIIEDKGE